MSPEGMDSSQLLHLKSAAADAEKLKAQVQAMEKALGILQHRYESRTNDLHKIRRERDMLAENKTSIEHRVEKFKDENLKLKAERGQLETDLTQARDEIKNGGGTLADVEAAREETRRLEKENESLKRKADVESNRAEYTREQYQTASSAAAQSGNEARQLRDENEDLKRRVATNLSELKAKNDQNDQDLHLARIAELELTLMSRDEFLRRKEEELREIRKNRPSTRSTSTQPRSPKWAANSRPTSPGVNNGNGNGGLGGRGSALRFSSDV